MSDGQPERVLLSGDEAVALAALHAGVALGTGYPGTPSTEILEAFSALGGRAQWAPNEKVAMEVAIGAAYTSARAIVTMKHVGLNVAADPLFTVTYTGVAGALVVVSADDPGMASSQNEQDNRRYAVAAGIPMLEPSDSQEAYEFTRLAISISERWRLPAMLRMTTRVCHSKTVVRPRAAEPPPPVDYSRNIQGRVMIPAYARPAHRKLREKLAAIEQWNSTEGPNEHVPGGRLGIITSGIAYQHAREAAPDASCFKIGMSYPLPLGALRQFRATVDRCIVIEEGDPYLVESLRTAGVDVEGKPDMYRFGEFNVARVGRILAGDTTPEPAPKPGKPPELCNGCPHRIVFQALRNLDCIVSGDIGCYSLGALPPFSAMEALVCMGASIGVGLGLRHVLPRDESQRVVSVIGDSTFVHSGITGVVEMVYNPPPNGHLLIILDNGTTAMTGMQEHPGTGRSLDHHATGKIIFEDLIRAAGVSDVRVVDPTLDPQGFETLVRETLERKQLAVIIARRTCLLATGKIKQMEKCLEPQPA